MSYKTDRRKFLQTTAAVGVGYWVAGGVQAQESKSPNERIQFACIGIGGKGSSDSGDAAANGDVVAICDVDRNRLKGAENRFKGAQGFTDYREMLDKLGDKIDAVTVSTPDHTHAVATAKALKMGKHCFVQKPLTHTIHEARVLGELAREKGVATQMGNQGTAMPALRKAAASIRAGAVGDVKEVHVWTNRPVWPQGGSRPPEAPVPEFLDWEAWIGPAQMRPYGNGYHPFSWRGFWDFGTGALGDMACHTMNMAFMALDLRNPVSVEAETSGHNQESFPKWSLIKYEFAANDNRGPLTLYWYDGGKRPDKELLEGRNAPGSGSLVIGTEGKLYSPNDYGADYELLGGAKQPEVEFEQSPGHFQEWVRAIKGGPAAVSNFPDYASPLTETVLLGNLAVYAGKKVEWDSKNMKATNAPELEALVRKQYREGYTL